MTSKKKEEPVQTDAEKLKATRYELRSARRQIKKLEDQLAKLQKTSEEMTRDKPAPSRDLDDASLAEFQKNLAMITAAQARPPSQGIFLEGDRTEPIPVFDGPARVQTGVRYYSGDEYDFELKTKGSKSTPPFGTPRCVVVEYVNPMTRRVSLFFDTEPVHVPTVSLNEARLFIPIGDQVPGKKRTGVFFSNLLVNLRSAAFIPIKDESGRIVKSDKRGTMVTCTVDKATKDDLLEWSGGMPQGKKVPKDK